jgi:hypothetical protein
MLLVDIGNWLAESLRRGCRRARELGHHAEKCEARTQQLEINAYNYPKRINEPSFVPWRRDMRLKLHH